VGPLFKVYFSLGRIYAQRGRYEEAICSFASCLQLVLKRSEEYREAVFEFRQMAEEMRQTCSLEELVRLSGLVAGSPVLSQLEQL
jgi:tetratricopeptide (TPR) repeat protein